MYNLPVKLSVNCTICIMMWLVFRYQTHAILSNKMVEFCESYKV